MMKVKILNFLQKEKTVTQILKITNLKEREVAVLLMKGQSMLEIHMDLDEILRGSLLMIIESFKAGDQIVIMSLPEAGT